MSTGSLKFYRNFDDPFAHVERAILRDKRMSLAERGFFALVLSLPTNKEMTLVYFAKVAGANKETVGKYFNRLEELGYLRRYRERGEHGVFGSTVYEFTTSGSSPCTDFPDTVEPDTVEPEPVKPSVKDKRKKNNNPISPTVKTEDVGELLERYAHGDMDLIAALQGFAENRDKLHKPIKSARSVTLLTNKLDKLSKGSIDVKIAMLNKAVERNWETVYALTPRDLEDLGVVSKPDRAAPAVPRREEDRCL